VATDIPAAPIPARAQPDGNDPPRPSLWERWLHVESPIGLVLDVGIVAVLAFAMAAIFREQRSIETVIAVVLPLLFRRRWPAIVLVVVSVGVLGTQGDAVFVDVAAVAIAAFTVGDLVESRATSAGIAIATAIGLGIGFTRESGDVGMSMAIPFAVIMPTWIVGSVVRSRRIEAVAAEAARQRAIADREAALRTTIAEQRRTIARELHDVVAHSVSVMLIQAGAARSVLQTSPEDAETALLAVESTGRDAMTELRRLLDVLADRDEAAGIAPQSGVAQLGTLVTRVREAGLPVELEVAGTPRALPPGMDVTVYRIVQEALTNALRYAGRARTVVRVAFAPSALDVEVVDDGPGQAAAPSGDTPQRGLIGMRERAAVFGGRVDAGPLPEHGYAVRACLPTEPTA
jgi:signal transduction histidine kinase